MENLKNGTGEDSVLESLYELWINQDPAYDENVRQLYGKLEEWTVHMTREENDRLTNIMVDLCIAYSRKGFLDGVGWAAC